MEELDLGVKRSFLDAVEFQESFDEPLVFNGYYICNWYRKDDKIILVLSLSGGLTARDFHDIHESDRIFIKNS